MSTGDRPLGTLWTLWDLEERRRWQQEWTQFKQCLCVYIYRTWVSGKPDFIFIHQYFFFLFLTIPDILRVYSWLNRDHFWQSSGTIKDARDQTWHVCHMQASDLLALCTITPTQMHIFLISALPSPQYKPPMQVALLILRIIDSFLLLQLWSYNGSIVFHSTFYSLPLWGSHWSKPGVSLYLKIYTC